MTPSSVGGHRKGRDDWVSVVVEQRAQGWAEKKLVSKQTGYHWNGRRRKSTVTLPSIAAKLLLNEHARSVRIVKRYIKHMAGATPYEWEKGYQSACNDILAALQRGRTGRGK